MTASLRWKWLMAGGLAASLVSMTIADGPGMHCQPPRPMYPICYPQAYSLMARSAVVSPFLAQSYNGQLLEQTVWNHFFTPKDPHARPTSEKEFLDFRSQLHPSGISMLDRMARRALDNPADGPVRLAVQRARDLRFVPGKVRDYQDTQAAIDRRRISAVREYLAANWPQVPVQIDLVDPTMPTYGARDAIGVFDRHLATRVFGSLPLPLQGALTTISLGGSQGLSSGPAESSSVAGTASVGAIGGEAGVGDTGGAGMAGPAGP